MAVQYDPSVIVEFADRLYIRARRVVMYSAFFGFLFGIVATAIFMAAFSKVYVVGPMQIAFAVFLVIAATAIGVTIGQERAFRIKLEAQRALCDVEVEKNTRKQA